ncbi:hypothetical protein BN903_240 [Halorubrum sp. AJ67]|nr:hypothetical protein BN903_240 [Halorubrum sp. AJ67]
MVYTCRRRYLKLPRWPLSGEAITPSVPLQTDLSEPALFSITEPSSKYRIFETSV